jgi:hypothetical protein
LAPFFGSIDQPFIGMHASPRSFIDLAVGVSMAANEKFWF